MKLHKLIPIIGLITLFGCSGNRMHKMEGMIWHTSYHVQYDGSAELADSILATLSSVDRSLNVFDSTSLVASLNKSRAISPDSHLLTVYEASKKIYKASGGSFDPTLSPLIKAWGFGQGHALTADTAAVDSILNFVGLEKTRLANGNIEKDDIRTSFNFSGVAKGYACDAVGEMFKRNGVRNWLVEIGGEIAASGKSPSGSDWKISIDLPVPADSTEIHNSYKVVAISNCGMATSGNYRNFHTANGRRFGHTISPSTGRPTETDVISATVIATSSMEADAAATACMALGKDNGLRMLTELGFEGLLILPNFSYVMTPGFPLSE